MNRPKSIALLLVGSLFCLNTFGLVGCSYDDEVTDPDPDPAFPGAAPSASSMQLDLSDLSGNGRPLLSGPCHNSSAFLVGAANILVVLFLATPVAVLGVTVESEPVYIGNQTWRWTGSGGGGSSAWSSQFEGHVLDLDTVEWTMIVSGTALGLDDFVWYTGLSDISANTGSWRFFDPLDETELGETMFSTYANIAANTGTLTFENRNDGGPGFGDELTYNVNGDALSVSFFSASENATLSIEWSKNNGKGSLTNFQGAICCWGDRPNYDDVQCP